ncbi:hypothetical protein SDC9_146491 [bioreactor metagenome]|uniref:Uncharacterized protein n=1 Tax=bioreactor metagenome TaxID=1076179 RepID=A0A645EBT5_9ZZZZ
MHWEHDQLLFSSDFEGGSCGSVEPLGANWYHLNLRPDTWFWFRAYQLIMKILWRSVGQAVAQLKKSGILKISTVFFGK